MKYKQVTLVVYRHANNVSTSISQNKDKPENSQWHDGLFVIGLGILTEQHAKSPPPMPLDFSPKIKCYQKFATK